MLNIDFYSAWLSIARYRSPTFCLLARPFVSTPTLAASLEVVSLLTNCYSYNVRIWARFCENMSYVICEQQRRRSTCPSDCCLDGIIHVLAKSKISRLQIVSVAE